MPEGKSQSHDEVFTERDQKALAWAVRRAAHNGGGYKSELAAARRALDRLRLGAHLSRDGAGLETDDANNKSTMAKSPKA